MFGWGSFLGVVATTLILRILCGFPPLQSVLITEHLIQLFITLFYQIIARDKVLLLKRQLSCKATVSLSLLSVYSTYSLAVKMVRLRRV